MKSNMDGKTIKANKRNSDDSVKNIRNQGKIPAILYGHDINSQPLSLERRDFIRLYRDVGSSSLIDLKVGKDKAKKVLIQEVQFHPVSDEPLHIDFYQVRMKEKIQTSIPLKFTGESPAVEEEGGNLITSKEELEVECLPQNLVDEIKVDISVLESFDDVVRVEDLDISKGIEVLDETDEVVATATPPRSEEELEALEEAPEESDVEDIEVEAEKEEEEGEGEETEEAEGEEAEKQPEQEIAPKEQ